MTLDKADFEELRAWSLVPKKSDEAKEDEGHPDGKDPEFTEDVE